MSRYPEGSKVIPLTQGQVAIVDAEDYNYLMQWKWHATHYPNDTNADRGSYYLAARSEYIHGKKVNITMHRQLMSLEKGDKRVVDHINGMPLDNRRSCNLQIISIAENSHKQKLSKRSTSGYRGVTFRKTSSKWIARIGVLYKRIALGEFSTAEEAAEAYNEAALEYYGEYTQLNKVSGKRVS